MTATSRSGFQFDRNSSLVPFSTFDGFSIGGRCHRDGGGAKASKLLIKWANDRVPLLLIHTNSFTVRRCLNSQFSSSTSCNAAEELNVLFVGLRTEPWRLRESAILVVDIHLITDK